ncbi:MAG: hypothetical protein A3G33_09920 [Omnitrophica bacterium RIFCSPLOWO2_12_FULL_44_17]|uniref:Metalloenzyme domain-containing protein n=1 Tax=Candidatus Danuiimicrobium aquiferis TaxID=1801832 RepID=A0A1G1L1V6_9BACT|nr:MAG: hypothetical protein A3B72_08690 [Omnitrophica bacterium RIFCSPHIGHO2_02_FULL_45_28]OGW88255.1 MAG: hypothetical protein A3E74_02720 [Omnitrophica bacterium RIFCSPHIGHO2_12_FULL_44_12]OGW99140.1 MAG: hypothetical protein A3G33_09920 [Omnitrophica bacterium RIFCSPLOWO2_12_FULL_44_17]OGX03169.1 MAG: hypothetical protein A3J12_09720 [Omnitrophica bacterium RIFCSPLOWO2_02_FULL_44_11]
MKYLMILADGIADHPSEALSGKTPLEVSRTPNLDYFAKIGKVGMVRTIPDRLDLVSHLGLISLLGYDPRQHPTGLGPLEAANLELKLEENEIAFRMNFISESVGILADATAGHITTREAKALVGFLNKKLSSDFVRFFASHEHQHIAVIKDARGYEALSATCTVPESIVGKPIEANLPKGPGEDMIKKLMYDAKSLLVEHEINQVRVDLGENPANMIWLWGQGLLPKLPKLSDRMNGITSAMVSTSEYAKGFARLIGMTVMDVAKNRIYPDYDYEGQAEAMMDLLGEKDFVCVHMNVCEEASREGDLKQKVLALEAIDHYVISRIKTFYESNKDIRILISPLLVIPHEIKKAVRESVPFIIAGKNIKPDEIERYNEATAHVSQLKFSEGWKLIEELTSTKDLG